MSLRGLRRKKFDALRFANPAGFAKLKTADFIQVLARLYAKLDYIHPFCDGNRRTFNSLPKCPAMDSIGSDLIARDKSANKFAFPYIQQDGTKRSVIFTMDRLEGSRSLSDLLHNVVRPSTTGHDE